MKRKLLLLAEVLGAVALALVGILGNPSVSRAAMPLPVQPWISDTNIRTSTTALGQVYVNESIITGPFGGRIAGTYWYSTGLVTPPDKETANGTPAGGLLAWYDLLCNAGSPTEIDTLADANSVPPNYLREPWVESTTAVVGTTDEWLLYAGPPFPVNWRLFGEFTDFFTSTGDKTPISPYIGVNLLAYTMPWAPKMAMTYSIVGKQSDPPSKTCSDSSSDTNSHITGIFANPSPEGDSDGPCDVDTAACADKQIHGFWTNGRVELATSSGVQVPVTKRVLNNGPEVGSFVDIWDVEAQEGVTATWETVIDQSHWDGSAWVDDADPTVSGSGVLISFPENDLPVSVPVQYEGTLNLECGASEGYYLVTLKDFTYPQAGTEDNDLASNMALYAVLVKCGNPIWETTDKRVITLRKTLEALSPTSPDLNVDSETGEHIQLVLGQTATVSVDATEINISEVPVMGRQTFVAETPPDITAEFVAEGGDVVVTGGVQFDMEQQPGTPAGGQIDVVRNLNITCTVPGIYPVAVKVIDVPLPPIQEAKPADNVRYNVIKVWCWTDEGEYLAAIDGIDDGTTLTPRWTVLAQRDDIPETRKPYDAANPLALASDSKFAERTVDMQCFFVDADGAPNQNGDVFEDEAGTPPIIEDWESQMDPDRPYGLDDDQDCLGDPMFTQPSHPVDEKDSNDTDGDGVSDAVEDILGSDDTDPNSVPEANLGASATLHNTCTDGVNNDGDADTDTDAECSNADGDGDGWANWIEAANDPDTSGDADATPENLAASFSCNDGVDNDGDGDMDGADSDCIEAGVALCADTAPDSIGALVNHNVHNDEDCDGLKDGLEKAWGSNPMLADSDGDGATDFAELLAFSNPLDPDTDGDGLLDKPDDDYEATPYGGATNSTPESALAGNCADGLDNDTDGRIDGADPNCDATDTDGDTVADADEDRLDSNPYDIGLTTESQLAGTCSDGIDNDGDGRTDLIGPGDTGCKTTDSDGDGSTDYDERGLGSVWLEEANEAANSDDNCPYAYNPDQANFDGRPESNGPFIAGGVRSNPNADLWGDACDVDDDNDRAYDASETVSLGTDPYLADTDGDHTLDGVESITTKNPLDPNSRVTNLSALQQRFFRACHMNLPDPALYPSYSPGYSGSTTTEIDPDNDGIDCPYTSPPPSGDKDADNGASAFANLCANPICTEYEDLAEIKRYGTWPAAPESDGDACEDWIEITDINGDRAANALDAGTIDLRLAGSFPAHPISDAQFDLNGDYVINALDAAGAVLNSGDIKGDAGHPANCLPVASDLQR